MATRQTNLESKTQACPGDILIWLGGWGHGDLHSSDQSHRVSIRFHIARHASHYCVDKRRYSLCHGNMFKIEIEHGITASIALKRRVKLFKFHILIFCYRLLSSMSKMMKSSLGNCIVQFILLASSSPGVVPGVVSI